MMNQTTNTAATAAPAFPTNTEGFASLRLEAISGVDFNYDPETARDGGGYFQPYGWITFTSEKGFVAVEVDDASCGDFGERWSATAYMPDGTAWHDGESFDAAQYAATPYEENAFLKRYGFSLGEFASYCLRAVRLVAWATK